MAEGTSVLVDQLSVKFGEFTAVNNISFSVKKGEIFGFLGANGAGKTTTIRVLCGLLTPSRGETLVAGFNVASSPIEVKRRVGYMSQRFTLYDDLTVGENLRFAAQLRKLDKSQWIARQKKLLEFISFDRNLNTSVKDLPGGIKQQVSLAAALLHEPEVIFLDEPTAGVTPVYRSRFWALIRQLSKEGRTVFVTTHYMDEAEQCGRIALMKTGELIALDSPDRLKIQNFPNGLLELEPVGAIQPSKLHAAKDAGLFTLVEPYGMRFHAELAPDASVEKIEQTFPGVFKIRNIAPTLEDVFIRQVEGT